jgi:DNA-binding transcriptional MerR regulator
MSGETARARGATTKSENAFRTISEVSAELDLPQHVLRFWETRFSQIKPMKRNGGRRLYRPDHVALLKGIKALLYEDGMTIKGVQKLLRERGPRAVAARGASGAGARLAFEGEGAVPEEVTERLAALRERLDAHASATGDGGADPRPEAGTEGEPSPNAGGEAEPVPGTARARQELDDAEIAKVRESIARLEAILAQLESK